MNPKIIKCSKRVYSSVTKTSKKRFIWLDVLRGIAIIAVIIDHAHSKRVEYNIPIVQTRMFFSVSWFIFMSGFTSALSFLKKKGNIIQNTVRFWLKRLSLVVAYVVASVVSYKILSSGKGTMHGLLIMLKNFSVMAPYYYLYIIFQLLLYAPFLIILTRLGKSYIWKIAILIVLTLFSYTCMQSFETWGHQIEYIRFGGPYLPIFYIGILYYLYQKFLDNILPFVALPVFLLYEYFFWINGGGFVTFKPNIHLFLWSLSFWYTVKFIITKTNDIFGGIYIGFAYFGRHSLSIFLYHFLLLSLTVSVPVTSKISYHVLLITIAVLPSVLSDVSSKMLHVVVKKFQRVM